MKFQVRLILKPYRQLVSEYGKSFEGEFVPDDDDIEVLKKMIQKYMDE